MADESAVKVCVRVRPLIQREQAGAESTESVPIYWRSDRQAIHQVDDGTVAKTFNYDRVFSTDESTSQLYQEIAKPLVVSAVKGYNGTIFAYGQTSSGKTFTMMGNACTPGVIPLAMEDVFHTIKTCPEKEFLLRVSYMEIYNETVTDLLCDSWKRKPLEIREGNYKNVYVADLTEELVRSADQVMAWIRKGEKNRHYGKTKMNQRSSRSHTIFRMILESRERSDPASGENVDSAIIVSHLNLVDLAGAERASQTGAEGTRFKEGCNINRSLFTLSQVIKKLSEENQGGFTNYRDSKLTRILQNSLGGNAKTVIICTVTPAVVDETLSTLQFASTAKRMKNDPHVTEVSDDGALLRRYRNEIVDLKRRLEEVSSVTRTAETEKEVLAQLLQEKDQLQREQEDRIKNLTNIIVTSSNFVAAEKKIPKRRVTWGGKHLKDMLLESHSLGEGEMSFAEATKKRKVDLSALAERDEEGDEFCSRWEILEEPTFDGDMNQSNITTRSFDDGYDLSPLRMSELSEKVSSLELQLKTEVQEKQDALETKAALEKRVAEMEVESLAQKEALERKAAELEAVSLQQKEALEKVAELESEAVGWKDTLEMRVAEQEAESLEQKEALEKRLAVLLVESQRQKEALEKRVAELEAEVLERRVTEQEAEALKNKVPELEAEALEQKEALEMRMAEQEAESLEQKEALEKRLAELLVESQGQKEALEKRVAELEAEVLERRVTEQEAEALKNKVAELEAEALEQKEALEMRMAEQETESLEQEEVLEGRLAELKAKSQAQKEALEERVVELETESQGQKEALERRVAELEAEALQQKESLEKRVAELQQQLEASAMQFVDIPEDAQDQYKKDLGETIQLCETLVIEKEAVAAERDFVREQLSLLEEENRILQETTDALRTKNCTLRCEKDQLLREVEENKELEEFNALEQESTRHYESELKSEIASLQSAVDQSLSHVQQLEANLAAKSAELTRKDECIAELRDLSGKDLVQQIEQLKRSLEDAEAVSRDTKKEWAILRSENLALQERDAELTATFEKLQAEVQSLHDQQGADKACYKKMQADLQRELQAAFEENTKLTALLDGKVPKNLIDSIELEKQVAELKKELELSQERAGALKGEVEKLTALKDLPAKVDQLMRQICDLTEDLCSVQAEKDSLEAARSVSDQAVRRLKEEMQQTQHQLADTQARLGETEHRASELSQQHMETCGQLEVLQSNTEIWTAEKQQLLNSIESLSLEVEQRNKQQQDLENKLAEQQQLLKDLEKELAEEQASKKEKQELGGRCAQLEEEIKKLGEELEALQFERIELKNSLEENMDKMVQQTEQLEELREERNQLKMDLQENVEMMIENQEELRIAQGKIKEQQKIMQKLEDQIELMKSKLGETKETCLPNTEDLEKKVEQAQEELRLQHNLSEEREAHLQLQVQQQGEELETLRAERVNLQHSLHDSVEKCAEAQAQLHSVQEELEQQQKVTSDLTVQNAERVSHLEQQISDLTENLCSAQADRDSLVAAKSTSDQEVQRLEEELLQAKASLREAQHRASELNQQHPETHGQPEALQSDPVSWTMERQHLLSSIEGLSQEVEQNNKQQRDLENKLAEQQQLLKDLEKELAEEQAAKKEKQELGGRAAQLEDEVRKLGEELEALRAERPELQNTLQETVDKYAEAQAQLHSVQEELERQQKVTSDLTVENAERVFHLEQQIRDLTEDLRSAQADKDSLEVAKSANDQEIHRLEEEMQQAQRQLADTQARLGETEHRASELSQQHMETCGQLEVLQSNTEIWTAEKQQLLNSIESLSLEVEQRNKQQRDLENKLAEQQQLLKDLEKELAEEQAAKKEKQELGGRCAQLEEEVRKLEEELEALRAERPELQNTLQETVDKYAEAQAQLHSVQEELERQEKVTSDLTVENAERVFHLEQQICDLTEDLRSAQADKDSLEVAKCASDQEVQRLEGEMQQTQARLREAEHRASELSQQRMETCSQLEALQSDTEIWKMEKLQLLSSVEGLSQEVDQRNKQQRDLEDKLAKQQQLLKHLEKELAEEQAAKKEKQELDGRSAQLEDELRSVQEDLEQQQQMTTDLTVQSADKVRQLSKELEQQQEEGRQLKAQLGETLAQLQAGANQRRSPAEEARRVLRHKLRETQQRLLGLFERLELFRSRALQACDTVTAGLEETSLLQNKLVFHVLPTMAPTSRKLSVNFCKSTDDIKCLLSQTAKLYAHLAAMNRQQFEAEAQHDLARVEEQRLQDLLLGRTRRQDRSRDLALLDFQDVWDQKMSELLEKRESYVKKLQGTLNELEEAMARSAAIVSDELSQEQRTTEELRVLCSVDMPDLAAVNGLLERELRRRTILVQQEKEPFQLLRDQYFNSNQRLKTIKKIQLKEDRGQSQALLQAGDISSVQTETSQLAGQLKQAEQQIEGLQARLRELEETHATMEEQKSSHAAGSALLQNQLNEVRALLGEKDHEVQVLQEQLKAQVKKGMAPGTAELEEMKTKLVKMEVERSVMTSNHQEEVARLTALLDHKEEALRKLKETLRKLQNQGDEFSSVGGATCPKASACTGGGRLVQSTAQMERAKLENHLKHLEEEVDRLQGLVSSQKEEITKWKSRALKLKENQRDLLNRQKPASPQRTPTKRQQGVAPCDTPWADGTPKKMVATPIHPQQQELAFHASRRDFSETDGSEPESDLEMVFSQSTPQSADSGGIAVGEEKESEWWPLSPNQADNCKAQ